MIRQRWQLICRPYLRCDFEQTLPFRLRCRPAMEAMLSRYADEAAAHAASPSVTRSNLKLTFQVRRGIPTWPTYFLLTALYLC